jgi:hypothetical protein
MKIAKSLLLGIIACWSVSVFAADSQTKTQPQAVPGQPSYFPKLKEHNLREADKQIMVGQQYKACLMAAQTVDAIDICDDNNDNIVHYSYQANKENHQQMKEQKAMKNQNQNQKSHMKRMETSTQQMNNRENAMPGMEPMPAGK